MTDIVDPVEPVEPNPFDLGNRGYDDRSFGSPDGTEPDPGDDAGFSYIRRGGEVSEAAERRTMIALAVVAVATTLPLRGTFGPLPSLAALMAALGWIHLFGVRTTRRSNSLLGPAVYAMVLALCVSSVAWSWDKPASINSSVSIAVVGAVGLYVARSFHPAVVLKSMMMGIGVVAGISVLTEFNAPFLAGFDSDPGQFNGIYSHKNELGRAVVIATGMSVSLTYAKRYWPEWLQGWDVRSVKVGTGTVVLGLFLLWTVLQTRSATSLVAIAGIGVVTVVLFIFARVFMSGASVAGVTLVLLAGAVVLTPFIDPPDLSPTAIEEAIGRQGGRSSFEVRRGIWADLDDEISRNATFGHGIGYFDARDTEYWNGAFYEGISLRQSHSGYVQTLLQLGFVGLAMILGIYLLGWSRGVVSVLRRSSLVGIWSTTFFALMLGINLTFSYFLNDGLLGWMLTVTTLAWANSQA